MHVITCRPCHLKTDNRYRYFLVLYFSLYVHINNNLNSLISWSVDEMLYKLPPAGELPHPAALHLGYRGPVVVPVVNSE